MNDNEPPPARARASSAAPGRARDPERTRIRILDAARDEFSEKELSGGRVNTIAERAEVNKQLLYYYSDDKDTLFGAVLERAYRDIREQEKELGLDTLPPEEAIRRFVQFNFNYIVKHRYFVALPNDENLHEGRHAKANRNIPTMQGTMKSTLGQVIARGLDDGSFTREADPVELYIAIASLCCFFLSDRHTLLALCEVDLLESDRIASRRAHVTEMILSYLRGTSDIRPAPDVA